MGVQPGQLTVKYCQSVQKVSWPKTGDLTELEDSSELNYDEKGKLVPVGKFHILAICKFVNEKAEQKRVEVVISQVDPTRTFCWKRCSGSEPMNLLEEGSQAFNISILHLVQIFH